MAYCRFGDDSDAYMYYDGKRFCCCTCRLNMNKDIGWFDNVYETRPREMLIHLTNHITLGGKIPERTLDRLREDIKRMKRESR